MDPFSAASVFLRLGGTYLIGSIPVANAIARFVAGEDLRGIGTGTVSATNVYRVAGLPSFVTACLLDVSKGAISVALLRREGAVPIALAAGLTLVGHNWSPWLRGGGGRGLLPAFGALLVTAPLGAALMVGGIIIGYLAGDTAPACLAIQVLVTPVLAVANGSDDALLGLAVAAPMLAKRLLGNTGPFEKRSRHVYLSRLIYDRDAR